MQPRWHSATLEGFGIHVRILRLHGGEAGSAQVREKLAILATVKARELIRRHIVRDLLVADALVRSVLFGCLRFVASRQTPEAQRTLQLVADSCVAGAEENETWG